MVPKILLAQVLQAARALYEQQICAQEVELQAAIDIASSGAGSAAPAYHDVRSGTFEHATMAYIAGALITAGMKRFKSDQYVEHRRLLGALGEKRTVTQAAPVLMLTDRGVAAAAGSDGDAAAGR
jgi:hypothetical protein